MPRVPPVEENQIPEVDDLIEKIKRERGGKLLLLYKVLLNSPPVAWGWLRLLTAIRQECRLPGRIRELVILRIAKLNGADYEFDEHIAFALKEGVPQSWIDTLERGERPADLGAADTAALDYADEMTRVVAVSDPVYAALGRLFSHREIVELTATIAAYNMVSRFLAALRIH
jgi:alkylhydroperoxidase family enzyme